MESVSPNLTRDIEFFWRGSPIGRRRIIQNDDSMSPNLIHAIVNFQSNLFKSEVRAMGILGKENENIGCAHWVVLSVLLAIAAVIAFVAGVFDAIL